ncbi:hypothetical protein [Agromyces sp. LHK192]|uniref:hypothetical protein n=1 Tax=Agromyces sp. LHK192 TaxID=2498704 RepID=UPI000FD97E2E|nr:hypothetical protein [Agromyces sp. LHK192]
MTALEILSVAVEVLSWIGLGVGVPLLIAALIARAVDASRDEVDVVVLHPEVAEGAERMPGQGRPVLRWFAGDELHERPVEPGELDEIDDHDGAVGYARGGDLRFHRRGSAAKVLTTLAVVLLGVGSLSLIASFVLMFVDG